MIKFKNRKVIEVQDWDDLVQKVYNRPYSFQQQDGCKDRGVFNFEIPNKWGINDFKNDTLPEVINGDEMGVSFKSWLERDPREWNGEEKDERFIDMYWERNFYPNVDMIIEDLYKKGLLEIGEYCISIDW